MSTTKQKLQNDTPAVVNETERSLTYIPFGETKAITLTLSVVRANIAVPTRQGHYPTSADLVRFMMLCQARELNPWVGDAFLVGYDTQDGPKFSLITAIQALLKRAEANPNFDGMESGVVVTVGDKVIERPGNLVFPNETLYGGWARLWRKDRSHAFYDALKLATYNTGKSQWAKDPAGMIDKCAQASVLRLAFPTQLGSLYIEQERGVIERREAAEHAAITGERVSSLQGLTKQLTQTQDQPPTAPADEAAQVASPGEDLAACLRSVLSAIEKATTVAEIEQCYDGAVGPDSVINWPSDMLATIEAAREARKSQLGKTIS